MSQVEKKYLSKMKDFGEVLNRQHSFYGSDFIKQMIESGGEFQSDKTGVKYSIPTHFGFCYGVEKSIDMAFETVNRFPDRNIYLTHDVIHNPKVNQDLMNRSVTVLERDEANQLILDPINSEDIVVISAFGSKTKDVAALRAKGCVVVDTTCGAIVLVWKRVEKYAKNGVTSVIHGIWNHEETQATASQATNQGGHYLIIRNMGDAELIQKYHAGEISDEQFMKEFATKASEGFKPNEHLNRIGLASQTTMFKSETLEIQQYLTAVYEKKYSDHPELGSFEKYDTICSATQERQDAIYALLQKPIDLMIIIGGFNSSNTTHLSEIASLKYPTFHIQGPEDILSKDAIRHLDPAKLEVIQTSSWMPKRIREIGISTGASTPDISIEQVIEVLETLVEKI